MSETENALLPSESDVQIPTNVLRNRITKCCLCLQWHVCAALLESAEETKERRKAKQWQFQIVSVSATSTRGLWELKSGSKGTRGAFEARAWPSAQNLLLLAWAAVFVQFHLNKWSKPKWHFY